jgi:N-acetylmuramoyl-L-alanine amidase
MLKIDARHRLVGEQVAWQPTPNIGGALTAQYLVMHYTAGSSAASAITTLTTKKPQGNASAHLVLARDGAITQLAPFNVVTWHAGISQWDGIVGLNNAAIGIEVDNAGALDVIGSKFVAWFGREVPAGEVLMAAHKHGGPVRPWQAYTAVQIERCLELTQLLVQRYRLAGVLGHDDIARGRKLDPGPAFPLASIASRALGREDDAPAICVVTAETLNIRSGPDASFPQTAPPLRRGTRVELLEPGSRWSRVEVDGPTDVEGWVNNRFIERVKAAPTPHKQHQPAAPKKARVRKKPTRRVPRK